jgi:hypothetical protein
MMSQGNTTNQNSQRELQIAQEINRETRARVDKLNKSFKTTIIVGVAIAVIVIIYMSVLYSNFSDSLKAENLADFVAVEVSNRIPEVSREMEMQLKNKAPRVVKSVSTFVVDESIPLLRKLLEEQVTSFSEEFIKTAPNVLNDEVYSEMVRYSRSNLQEAITTQDAMDNPKFVAALEKKLIAQMEKGLKGESKDQVTKEMQQSLGSLKNILTQLKQLSNKQNLSQGEKLTKQLLSSWWTMLANNENSDEITKKDVKIVTEGLKSTAEEIIDGTKEAIK